MTEPGESEPVPADEARTARRLLEFLVCPVTKTTLEVSADNAELISRAARLAFPIRDGIPLLTVESARELEDDELRK
ncbi:MAG: Trm112 family protein [Hyphomicrobiaceae bacterium]